MAKREINRITALDRELVDIIRDFLILTPLSWSIGVQREFMASVARGRAKLPEVSYPPQNNDGKIAALRAFVKKLGTDEHPAILFLRDTAKSYLCAYNMLQGAGTEDVTRYSKRLYGSPADALSRYNRSNIDVAQYFLRIVRQYHLAVEPEPLVYSDAQLRRALQQRVQECISVKKDPVTITVDDAITARATAGPNYVKIRRGTRFSEADLRQLLHHEVFTHTLTYLNGRKQPVLLSLGYGAPRTTATQEGLAMFSEYINSSIELTRLQRIALRIVALDMAEQGANLIDLFRFFKEHGQNDEESYYSAMRIFRGGTPKGGIIFYKDNVYLRGLIEVEGFLKRAMHKGTVHDIAILFAGKLTTGDVTRLHPLIEEGYIAPPAYMPLWAKRSGELASHLAINDLTERFRVKKKNA